LYVHFFYLFLSFSDSGGNELYLTKMEEYLLYPDEEVCFWDLYVRGKRKKEVGFGE
jgi:hypothetical protein